MISTMWTMKTARLEEEVATNADLKLTVTDESEAGLGGLPQNLPEEEE